MLEYFLNALVGVLHCSSSSSWCRVPRSVVQAASGVAFFETVGECTPELLATLFTSQVGDKEMVRTVGTGSNTRRGGGTGRDGVPRGGGVSG